MRRFHGERGVVQFFPVVLVVVGLGGEPGQFFVCSGVGLLAYLVLRDR